MVAGPVTAWVGKSIIGLRSYTLTTSQSRQIKSMEKLVPASEASAYLMGLQLAILNTSMPHTGFSERNEVLKGQWP